MAAAGIEINEIDGFQAGPATLMTRMLPTGDKLAAVM
jgi:hypothetical protein